MNKLLEQVVHDQLVCPWGASQAKRHLEKLEQAAVSEERRLVDIIWVHWDLPIARLSVQCDEVLGRSKLDKDRLNAGQRVAVWHRNRVYWAIVDADPSLAAFLASQNHRSRKRTGREANQVPLLHRCHLAVDFLPLKWAERPAATLDGGVVAYVNSVVNAPDQVQIPRVIRESMRVLSQHLHELFLFLL
jgi:hypothetical protein